LFVGANDACPSDAEAEAGDQIVAALDDLRAKHLTESLHLRSIYRRVFMSAPGNEDVLRRSK
jgi:hypothetical protein